MSTTEAQEKGRQRSLSDEQKDALIGEMLGDVQLLHKSMKDLVLIVRDSDERLSGRIVELREVSADFARSRDAALAHLATQASETAQRRFTDSMGGMLQQVSVSLVAIERLVHNRSDQHLFYLAGVAILAGISAAAAAVCGVWLVGH